MNDRYERYQFIYGNTVRTVEMPEEQPTEKRRPEQEPQRRTKTKVKYNPRVLEFNGRFTALLAVSIMAVVLFCVTYLYGQSLLHKQMNVISRKQTTLTTMKSENQSVKANLEKKVDHEEIRQRAEELGMVTPGEDQTIYYEGNPSDYVRQYADIPSEE